MEEMEGCLSRQAQCDIKDTAWQNVIIYYIDYFQESVLGGKTEIASGSPARPPVPRFPNRLVCSEKLLVVFSKQKTMYLLCRVYHIDYFQESVLGGKTEIASGSPARPPVPSFPNRLVCSEKLLVVF